MRSAGWWSRWRVGPRCRWPVRPAPGRGALELRVFGPEALELRIHVVGRHAAGVAKRAGGRHRRASRTRESRSLVEVVVIVVGIVGRAKETSASLKPEPRHRPTRPTDGAARQKCTDKFEGDTKGFAKGCIGKLEAKLDARKPKTVCSVTGDVGTLEGTVDAFVIGVVSEIRNAP